MTYDPDEQDELVEDAMAVGGPAFVEELHYAAMDAAETACAWDGNGDEPLEYRRAWIAAARRLVAERRAQVSGDAASAGARLPDRPGPCAAADPAAGPAPPGR